jgi:hypothetical protein
MRTGDIRSQIDAIWNSFWTGGISNPLEVMEQITYLLFLRRLDDLRWSRFKNFLPVEMYTVVGEHVFPLLLPPLALQQTFAVRIQSVESLKATHRAALQELDRPFASLQHRAFAGEL